MIETRSQKSEVRSKKQEARKNPASCIHHLAYKKIVAISDLIRFPKQYGTLLLLCPTLWSLFIASNGRPSLKILGIFILGTFLMRSAGCAINDIADRNFDRFVERTKVRPLADGRLTLKEALLTFFVLSFFAFCLVLFLNSLTVALSVIGILLASIYPFIKRISHLPQVFLGIAFGWGAIMAWSAVNNTIGFSAVLIFTANIFWSTAYDTIYALMDKEDDIKIGVKSTAILLGKNVYKALYLLYAAVIIILALVGISSKMGFVYFSALLLSGIILEYMVFSLKKSASREKAFRIFVANAGIGLLIMTGIVADFIF
ncbi:MAG: 4-hydroxybenzoate octaprenyltransferase [Deltaproteobacteria bacterium]|nr:4-hydroxybenzoate octaprenyltransferase [Deltaproteobacteria bacterium]